MKREQGLRLLSIIISISAFVAAALAGLWLTGLIAAGTPTEQIITAAALVLIGVTLLIALGVYLYVRSANDPADSVTAPSALTIQRDLMAYLRQNGLSSLQGVAAHFALTPTELIAQIDQLAALDLFSGYVQLEQDQVQLLSAQALAQLRQCAVCSAPLSPTTGVFECAACATQYFLARETSA